MDRAEGDGMSTTVYEALLNAQINFKTLGDMGGKGNPYYVIAMEQLNNAIDALTLGLLGR